MRETRKENMVSELAQKLRIDSGSGTPYEIEGPTGIGDRFPTLSSLVTNALPIIFSIAGAILFIYLIWGGFDFLTSMGDPKKAESGKNKITSAIIGFIIIFTAFWITQIIDYLFKLGIYNPVK